jgi:hypothetical protein
MPKTKKVTLAPIERRTTIAIIIIAILVVSLGGLRLFKNKIFYGFNMMSVSNSDMETVESYPSMMTKGSFSEGGIGAPMMNIAPDSLANTPLPRQKIDTANLSLLVDNVSDSIATIKNIALGVDGYVGNSNIYEAGDDMIQGNITIRIPAENFESILNQIKSLAVKVEHESTNGEDVTEQLIDTNSRITNLKATEEQYRKILKSATKTDDILKVTSAINNVRQRIESLEGQLKYLDQAVAMSTITVNLKAVADVQVLGLTWKPLVILKQALRNMVDGLLDYVEKIIYLAFYLPVIAIWLATVGAIVFGGYKVALIVLNKTRGKKK